jgi:hypothetical protein
VYFKDLRNKGLPVTREALMSKSKESDRKSNIPFKASRGWCEKFLKREMLLQRKTKISQKLLSEFETELTECQRFVNGLRRRNNYSLCQIGNADETAVFFRHVSQYYRKFRMGETIGNENHRL